MLQIIKAQAKHSAEVRKILKDNGISMTCKLGCNYVYVGRQCLHMEAKAAHALMNLLKASGYHIDMEKTCRELADKGLFDSVMVAKIA